MKNPNSNNTDTMLALIAGVAVGAAIGIILAPEKGSATRNKINDAVRDVTSTLKNVSNEGFNAITRLKDSIYANAGTFTEGNGSARYSGSDSKQHI